MRILLVFLSTIILFTACQNNTENTSLDKAFIQSFKDQKFKELERFFPTKSFYKSLGKEMPERNDAEIDSFLTGSNQKLEEDWEKINTTIKGKMIDPGKIVIKETLFYKPYRESSMQAMIIVYEYKGKTWDDLSMIVRQRGDTTYLLGIPNPTRAFKFSDTSLRESTQAKAAIELQKPEFQQDVQKHVTQMIDWAKNDSINEFAGYIVYNGEDKNRSWKSAVNVQNEEESRQATDIMEKVKKATGDCPVMAFDTIEAERESEGYWIVQPVICGKKIIRFPFLKIKDKFLMGNIDVETKEE